MTKHDLKELAAIGAELGAAKAENEKLRGLLHGAHDTIRELAEDLDEEEFQATIDQLAEIELALAPKQAEPTDAFTATDMATAAAQGFRDGQAAVEKATAQDEHSPGRLLPTADIEAIARNVHGECSRLPGSTFQNAAHNAILYALERIARPAQTEQQPVAWKVFNPRTKKVRFYSAAKAYLMEGFRNVGYETTPLYAALVVQTAPAQESEHHARLLGQALGECIAAAGIIRPDASLSGPELLMFADDLKRHLAEQTAPQPEQSGLVEALEEIASGLQAEFAWEVAEQALAAYRAALSAQGAGDADS